jgi:predicted nucleic acid-binding protein
MQETIKEGLVVNSVTIMEVAHYFCNLSKSEFDERIETTLSLYTLRVVSFTLELMEDALSFVPQYSRFGLGARDCVIIATMKTVGTDILLSHDMAFKNVRNITVIDEIR